MMPAEEEMPVDEYGEPIEEEPIDPSQIPVSEIMQ